MEQSQFIALTMNAFQLFRTIVPIDFSYVLIYGTKCGTKLCKTAQIGTNILH